MGDWNRGIRRNMAASESDIVEDPTSIDSKDIDAPRTEGNLR